MSGCIALQCYLEYFDVISLIAGLLARLPRLRFDDRDTRGWNEKTD